MLSKLYSFDDFLFESIDEVSFILSNDLIEVLNKIENKISISLIKDHSQTNKKKITYVDIINGEYDKWSFVNSSKVAQYLEEIEKSPTSYINLNNYKSVIIGKFQSKAKIGRLINKIYPDTYSASEIEIFVNLYKKYFATQFELIDIVNGHDINKWYDCKNYNKDDVSSSELQNSCMSYSDRNEFMDFYAINDDKIQMVILYSDENKNKIDARAILWTPDTIDGKKNIEGIKFMDRVYYNRQEHFNILSKYAEMNGWLQKYRNSGSIGGGIINPVTKENKQIILALEDVEIPVHHKMPYADTLAVFDPETNTLSNDEQEGSDKKLGYLSSTGGQIDGLRWLESKDRFYHSTDIAMAIGNDKGMEVPTLKSEAIQVPAYRKYYTKEYLDTKKLVPVIGLDGETKEVFEDDVVENDDGKKYFKNDVMYSNFLDEYIPKGKAQYVPSMDSYMPLDELVLVITEVDRFGDDIDVEYFHIDDPREPYFKHTDGKYYINELKDKITNLENEKN